MGSYNLKTLDNVAASSSIIPSENTSDLYGSWYNLVSDLSYIYLYNYGDKKHFFYFLNFLTNN